VFRTTGLQRWLNWLALKTRHVISTFSPANLWPPPPQKLKNFIVRNSLVPLHPLDLQICLNCITGILSDPEGEPRVPEPRLRRRHANHTRSIGPLDNTVYSHSWDQTIGRLISQPATSGCKPHQGFLISLGSLHILFEPSPSGDRGRRRHEGACPPVQFEMCRESY
jgi:hypothetical protein